MWAMLFTDKELQTVVCVYMQITPFVCKFCAAYSWYELSAVCTLRILEQ